MSNLKNEPTLINWEVVNNAPLKFIGKSVYVRIGATSNEIINAVWKLDWIFENLDGMDEYATEDIHDAAFVTYEKFDDKNELMGYTVGRFMKADTPVPDGMDYYDVTEGYIAKAFICGGNDEIAMRMLKEKIEQQYVEKSWIWSADIFPNRLAESKKDISERVIGCYILCEKK